MTEYGNLQSSKGDIFINIKTTCTRMKTKYIAKRENIKTCQ